MGIVVLIMVGSVGIAVDTTGILIVVGDTKQKHSLHYPNWRTGMSKKYYRENDEDYYKQYTPITSLEAWCDFSLYSLICHSSVIIKK